MKYVQLTYAVILAVGVIFSFCYIVYLQFTKPKENGKKRLNKYQISYKNQIYTVPKEVYHAFSDQLRENKWLQMEIDSLKLLLKK